MSLAPRLGFALVAGVGGGVPFALGAFGGERYNWGEFVFKSKSSGGAKVNNQY